VLVRVGVIGLGENWERRHKPALLRYSDKFEVRAVFDEVAHRTKVQAAELDCDAADGFTCLVERDDVDAVFVLANTWCGVEPIRAACRARKAIYVGCPFGPNLAFADETIAELSSSGVRIMAEFPWRFYPATIRLMELLASGLGAPQLASCEQNVLVRAGSLAAGGRPQAEIEAADVVLHMADWLRFVFSRDPVRVQSLGEQTLEHGPCRHFESLVADFGSGGVGQVAARQFRKPQWTDAAKFRGSPSFQVVAEHGVAFVEMPGEVTWFDHAGRHDESLEMDRPLGEMLIDRFYRIVVHGLNPSPGLNDAARARAMLIEARHAHSPDAQRTVG